MKVTLTPDPYGYRVAVQLSYALERGSDGRFYVRESNGDRRSTLWGPIDCPDVGRRLIAEQIALRQSELLVVYGTVVTRFDSDEPVPAVKL